MLTAIIVAAGSSQRMGFDKLFALLGDKPVLAHTIDAFERTESVRAGLEGVETDSKFIAVHDAARPLVTPEQIERVFALAREHGAAALAAPITDTLKRAAENHFVTGGVPRENLYAMQTPQIFARELLERAYAGVAANKLSITDEVSAVEHLGEKVVLVPNDEWNIKITYPRDLLLAQSALTQRSSR